MSVRSIKPRGFSRGDSIFQRNACLGSKSSRYEQSLSTGHAAGVPCPMAYPEIPDDITRVTEAELQEKLSAYLDRVAFAEDELLVTVGSRWRP